MQENISHRSTIFQFVSRIFNFDTLYDTVSKQISTKKNYYCFETLLGIPLAQVVAVS